MTMIESKNYRIADGLVCQFKFDPEPLAIHVEWDPAMPRHLDGQAMRRYCDARTEFMHIITAWTGKGMAVVDVGKDSVTLGAVVGPPKAGHA